MEALLRLSGLVPQDEEGKTDLGSLELRLAEHARVYGSPGAASTTSRLGSAVAESQQGTPLQSKRSIASVGVGSETVSPARALEKDKTNDDEVDDLSDLMCSLVTNNQGESRYIGKRADILQSESLRSGSKRRRLLVWLFHPLTSRYQLGRREDR